MPKKLLIISLSLAGSISMSACATEDDEGASSHVFRGGDTPFWDLRADDPGNGAVALHDGDGPLIPDCIIWDIDGGEDVYEGPAVNGNLLMQVRGNEILGPDGRMECRGETEGDVFKLRDAQGTVVFSVGLGRFIFGGDVATLPEGGTPQWHQLLNEQLAYEVCGDQVFDGRRRDGEVIVTGDARLNRANPMRKLLFAALAAGECGSNGPFVPAPPAG